MQCVRRTGPCAISAGEGEGHNMRGRNHSSEPGVVEAEPELGDSVEMLRSLRQASRALRRAPAFSAAIIVTLTIGVGASAAIFTVVNGVLLRPLPYGHPDALVGAWHDLPGVSLKHVEQTAGTYFTYKRLAHTITGIAEYDGGAVTVNDPSGQIEPQRVRAAWTSANLFELLEVSPIRGRTYTAAEDVPKGPSVVVVSEGL